METAYQIGTGPGQYADARFLESVMIVNAEREARTRAKKPGFLETVLNAVQGLFSQSNYSTNSLSPAKQE